MTSFPPVPATPIEISHSQLRSVKFYRHDDGCTWTILGPGKDKNASTAVRVAFDKVWAPDAVPWPSHWSPEYFMGLPASNRWTILASARRWDEGSYPPAAAPFRATTELLAVACTTCGAVVNTYPISWFRGQQTHLPGNCANGHVNPYINRNRLRANAVRSSQAVDAALVIIEASRIVRLVGPAPANMKKDMARLRCLIHDEEHSAVLQTVMRSLKKGYSSGLSCCGAHRLPFGNGKFTEEMNLAASRLGAAAQPLEGKQHGGIKAGCPHDNPRDILCGKYHSSEDQRTCIYLHATEVPGVHVFGITNAPNGQPRHGTWYKDRLIEPVWCRHRSDAVLVEAFFKHEPNGWLISQPEELKGRCLEGAHELTDASPVVFEERALELLTAVEELGHRAFAKEYLPWLRLATGK